MTLQEVKDIIAKELGYRDYDEYYVVGLASDFADECMRRYARVKLEEAANDIVIQLKSTSLSKYGTSEIKTLVKSSITSINLD